MKRALASLTLLLAAVLSASDSKIIENLDVGIEGFEKDITAIDELVTESGIVGVYRYSDGYWSWELHVEKDNSFALISISDKLEESEDGILSRHTAEQWKGTWRLSNDQLTMEGGKTRIFLIVRVGDDLGLVSDFVGYNGARRVFTATGNPLTHKATPDKMSNQTLHPTAGLRPSVG